MPVEATFKVEGLKELGDQLERLARSAQRGIQRKAMREAIKPVRNTARRLAPVKSGKGKRDIRAKVKVKGPEAVASVGVTKRRFYMNMQETGTRFHKAQPFLRPALDTEAQNVLAIYTRVMDEEIKAAIAREIDGDGEEDVPG